LDVYEALKYYFNDVYKQVVTNATKQNSEMELNEKTTEKLEGELRVLKIISGALIGVLSVLYIICVYGLLKKDDNGVFSALIVVPVALSTIIPVNYRNIKKIKAELKSRKWVRSEFKMRIELHKLNSLN